MQELGHRHKEEMPVSSEEQYKFFQNNCSDYVNSLFKLTGLPGRYPWYYTSDEIEEIPGMLRAYVRGTMGPGDKPQVVKGKSIDQIAEEYNVDPSMVSKWEGIGGLIDYEAFELNQLELENSFIIAPNPLVLYKQDPEDIKFALKMKQQYEEMEQYIEKGIEPEGGVTKELKEAKDFALQMKQQHDEMMLSNLFGHHEQEMLPNHEQLEAMQMDLMGFLHPKSEEE